MADTTWIDRIAGKPVLVFAVFLTLMTWWAGNVDFRAWAVPGGVTPFNYAGERGDWKIVGDARQAVFSPDGIALAAAKDESLRVVRRLPYDPEPGVEMLPLRISGRVLRHSDPALVLGRDRQTMFYVTYTRDGETLGHGATTRFTGQYGKRRFEYLVKPPSGTNMLELTWLVRGPGSWELQGLSVSMVAINPYYRVVASLLIAGWCALLLYFFKPVLQRARPRVLAVTSLAVGMVVLGTGLAQPTMQMITEPLMASLWQFWPGSSVSIQGVLKLGHILAFAFLSVVMLRLKPYTHMSTNDTLALLFTLAVATEALQRHRYNRSGEWSDVAIDAAGIAFGCILYRLTVHFAPSLQAVDTNAAR